MEDFNARLRHYWQRLQQWWADSEIPARSADAWRRADDAVRVFVHGTIDRTRAWWSARDERRREARANRPLEDPRAPRAPRRRRRQPAAPVSTVVVDRDDDVASVTGRIDAAPEADVVLMVPRAARGLVSPGAWARIAAHGRRHGVRISVVSPRREVRDNARLHGLPPAGSVRGLRRTFSWRFSIGDREFALRLPGLGTLLRTAFLAVVIGSMIFVGCYMYPTAEVVVTPASREHSRSLTVRVNPQASEPSLSSPEVPAETVRHQFTTTVSTHATGEAEVGDEFASTMLRFTNSRNASVTIPSGTRVDTEDGIGFSTSVAVTIPPGEEGTVPATAMQAGTGGNVDSQTIVSAAGIPPSVEVTNPSAASGGTDRLVTAVAEEDVDRVQEIADAVLRRIAIRELERVITDGTIFPGTVAVAVFTAEPLAQAGEPAEVFILEYTAIATVLVLRDATARRFGEMLLVDDLPDGTALLPGTTEATIGSIQVGDARSVSVELLAVGQIADLFTTSEVKEVLVGARPAEAAAELQSLLNLERRPQITLRPEILPWQWLPRRADRISIILAAPTVDQPDEDEEGEGDGEESEGEPSPLIAPRP